MHTQKNYTYDKSTLNFITPHNRLVLHFPAAVCTLAITKSPHLSMTTLSVCGARLESPSDRLALLSESEKYLFFIC